MVETGSTQKKRIDIRKQTGETGPALSKIMEESNIQQSKMKTIDVVFVIDATGSMKTFIMALKNSLIPIAEKINKASNDKDFETNFGIVFYRDKDDKEPYRVIQLEPISKYLTDSGLIHKKEPPCFVKELESVIVMGGEDLCDDAETGIRKAFDEIKWKSNDRFIVLLTDYPCHGSLFNGGIEDYYSKPDGEYNANEAMINTLKRFSEKSCKITNSSTVAYRLVGLQITSFTDKMYQKMKELLAENQFFKLNITSEKFQLASDDQIQEISKTIAQCLGGTIKKQMKRKLQQGE